MKRLVRQAFDKTLYHGTKLSKFKQIAAAGQLLPNETTGGGANGAADENFLGYTFLATTKSKAMWYAYDTSEREIGVIIEISVPADALLPDDNDDPNAKTWQESAETVEQVKLMGAVTDNYFRTVYFYEPETHKQFLECPYQQWEQKFAESKHGDGDTEGGNDDEETHKEFVAMLQSMGIAVENDVMVNPSIQTYLDVLQKYYSFEEIDVNASLYNGDVHVAVQGSLRHLPGDMIDVNMLDGNNSIEFVKGYEDPTTYLTEQYQQNPNVLQNLKQVFGNPFVEGTEDDYTLEQIEGWVLEDVGGQATARLKRKREVT